MTPTPIHDHHEAPASVADQAHHGPRIVPARLPGFNAESADNAFDVRRVIAALKFHWFLFLVLGSLAGAALGFAAWEIIPAKYTTYSILRVASNDAGLLGGAGNIYRNEFLTFLKTQADSIKSEFVLRAALRDSKIGSTATLRDIDDKVRWLMENIQVEFSEHSEIMKIVLAGENSQDLADIINAVHAAYMKEVVLVDQLKKKATLDSVDRSRVQLEENLKNLKAKLEIKQKRNPALGGAEIIPVSMSDSPLKVRVGAAEFAQITSELRRAETDLALATERERLVKARLDKVDAMDVTAAEFESILDRDTKFKELTRTAERAQQFAESLRNVYSSPAHADVMDADRKAKSAALAVEEHKRKRKTDVTREWQQANRRQITNDLEKISADVQAKIMVRATIKKQLDSIPPMKDATSNAAAKEKSPTEYDTDESGLVFAIGIYEDVLKKFNVMSVDQANAQPRVIELQKASVPIKKEMKKQVIGTVFAAMLGFLIVGACVTMYENRVQRLFGSRDISGMNLIGTLPELGSSDAIGGNDAQRMRADPFMEGVEKIRLMLSRNFLGKRAQSILITSAESGEGKTTLAGHLAVSLTRSERKTILLDANLRDPALHEYLGLPNQRGISGVLRGEDELNDAIQRTSIPNLWFLPAGLWDASAQQALSRDKFRRILDRLRQEFDYIVLDSHALTPAADSFVIGQHCDAVVVCARRFVSRKATVEQAYQRVCELGVPHTGLIFLGESAS